MGVEAPFLPQRLIIALLFCPHANREVILRDLEEAFGAIENRSRDLPFEFTDYYESEMGRPLERLFVSFAALRAPDLLAEIKVRTNGIERRHLAEIGSGGAAARGLDPARAPSAGGRTANIDPGFLSLESFVLATTKPRAHRIALAHGIYGEVELIFERGSFRPLPWTYPDYRSEAILAFLEAEREAYRSAIRRR